MNDQLPRQDLKNAAWVTISTRLDAQTLKHLSFNVERIYRLNPFLKINAWQKQNESTQEVEWENHSIEPPSQERIRLTIEIHENELQIVYANGIKSRSILIVEPGDKGAQLTLIDDYGDRGERDSHKVDRSLHVWGRALQTFFNHYRILRHLPYADNLIDRFWIKLSPFARRITYILLVITLVELFALLLIALVLLLV